MEIAVLTWKSFSAIYPLFSINCFKSEPAVHERCSKSSNRNCFQHCANENHALSSVFFLDCYKVTVKWKCTVFYISAFWHMLINSMCITTRDSEFPKGIFKTGSYPRRPLLACIWQLKDHYICMLSNKSYAHRSQKGKTLMQTSTLNPSPYPALFVMWSVINDAVFPWSCSMLEEQEVSELLMFSFSM